MRLFYPLKETELQQCERGLFRPNRKTTISRIWEWGKARLNG